jgi:hypothetical protein
MVLDLSYQGTVLKLKISSPKRAFDGEIDISDLYGKVILVTGGESVGLSSMNMNS